LGLVFHSETEYTVNVKFNGAPLFGIRCAAEVSIL
jgi:hypothetical protein